MTLIRRIIVRVGRSSPWTLAFLASFLFILVHYPGFLTLQVSPMAPTTWELQDPIVSQMTMVPGQRTASYELLHHFNLLWSNLRGLGGPILASDVQSAPMFPLTLLSIGVAERSVWNVMILSRLLLLGMAAFMVAWRIFGFRLLGSTVFCYTVAFGVNTVRWMNHPAQNGLLAALWYCYFVWSSIACSRQPFRRRFWPLTGVAVSFYAIFTCGFPESMASGVVLIACGFLVPAFAFAIGDDANPWVFLRESAVAHALGLVVAMPQIIALAEHVYQAAPGYRTSFGTKQFDSMWAFLPWIVRTSAAPPSGTTIHIFGLITLFLFFTGFFGFLFGCVRRAARRRVTLMQWSAILPGAFFIVKNFPVWPSFNTWVGDLPILRYCWIFIYFFPLMLWTVGYFAGQAADDIRLGTVNRGIVLVGALFSMGLGLFAASRSGLDVQSFILSRDPLIFVVFLTCLFIGLSNWTGRRLSTGRWTVQFDVMFTGLSKRRGRPLARSAVVGAVAILMIESLVTRPTEFLPYNSAIYREIFWMKGRATQIQNLLEEHQIPVWEMRERNTNGDHVHQGIATVDVGAPAILPRRLQMIRRGLFNTDWAGYLPLQSGKFPYSWQAISATIRLEAPDAALQLVEDPTQQAEILGEAGNYTLVRDHAALPRAYLTRHCDFVNDADAALAVLKDPTKYRLGLAILEDTTDSERAACLPDGNFGTGGLSAYSQVPIVEDRGKSLTLSTVRGPGIVVLNDNFYPGWMAVDRMSGQRIEIKPANVAFRGLVLSERRAYDIAFRYEPWWLIYCEWGIGLSLLVWLFMLYCAYRSGTGLPDVL
jgi:hypothetical protein